MPFGAVPWPDDLYLDGEGRISVGALPNEDFAIPSSFPDSMRLALADLDGFSPVAPIFFYLEGGSIDPSSLPDSPAATTVETSPIVLTDADPTSLTAFRRIPVLVHWHPELGQLALRPADGHALTPGRRYAAVLTTSLLDDAGMPIGADPRFAEVRDATARPEDAVLGAAYDEYHEVLDSLSSNLGIPRDRVAALAVFTVQRVGPDLRDARAAVWEGAPPAVVVDRVVASSTLDSLLGIPEGDVPGIDVPNGVAHSHIAWVVHGHIGSPSFLSAQDGVHGRFTRGADGALEVLRTDEVPFTISLPFGDLTRLPVVVFQHGLGAERSEMFAIADSLAAAGYAVLAIDIPFHGMRANGAQDQRHRFTGVEAPDGFGDVTGRDIYLDFLGIVDANGELPPFHPAYVRDVFRQSVVDLMSIVRLLREGDWTSLTATPGLEGLGFASGPFGFVGVSLGGIIGTIFTAVEEEIGASVLNVTGGDLSRLVEWSASFAELFLPILFPKLGLDPELYDPQAYPASFHPELALFQTVLDRGDSMSFGPILGGRAADVLFQMAEHDETVPNRATEALARSAGSAFVGADPAHTDLPRIEAPALGNLSLDEGQFTRGLVRFAPATHGLLSRRSDEQSYEHPPVPPFRSVTPVPVANPVDAAVTQLVHFFESWRGGGAEITVTESAP
jgi:hypothetical protein